MARIHNTQRDRRPLRRASRAAPSSLVSNWPRRFDDLPVLMTQTHVAELMGVSERTLERQRHTGGGIRFCKMGRKVLYRRDDVVRHLLNCCFENTAEVKASRGRT